MIVTRQSAMVGIVQATYLRSHLYKYGFGLFSDNLYSTVIKNDKVWFKSRIIELKERFYLYRTDTLVG